MCGIAGFQGSGSHEDARRMIARIAYRGPDLQDAVMIGDTGLAHARLSIIDLSHGADQPMFDEARELCIVFNGEIYNYKQLREGLLKTGQQHFRTDSDTEVLLHLYREHGAAMLPMLNGMFALAIHDTRDGSLFLARDRMGKKPLHYAEANGTFVFGSELKAVREHPAVRSALDPIALDQYLSFEYVPTPRSMVQGIRKLEPGHCMWVRNGRVEKDEAYWTIDLTEQPIAEDDAANRLDVLLRKATERRLMSDVPLGVFLSGGIDSSAVAYYAQQCSTQRIRTFSIGFEEASYDESAHARSVAERIGSDHHVETLRQRDSLDLIPDLYAKLDEPFADASLIPTHLLSRFARKHVTVALGGDGSDELLAGYPTFGADRFRAFFSALPAPAIGALRGLAELLPASDRNISFDFKVKQFLRGFGGPAHHVHTRWLGGFTPQEKALLLTPQVREQLQERTGLEPVDDLLSNSPWANGKLDEIIHVFLRTYLLDDILFKVDRASMYTSLEVRAPFMDVEVVEFINSLPNNLKRRGFNGKYLLKKVMRGKIPDAIIDRPKKGFGIPLSDWLRKELRPLCDELLASKRITEQGLFNAPYVDRIVREHMSGKANHRKLLWTLIVFQLWHKEHRADLA
ncbi:MAG: asparagine synthase (glutamine-hydrolyzing) [Flavobacteriales bacterium]|nr:asparagine synthase (glutamine-hydrolyzing) [Flavobacteriales bacterium]MCC6938974.1 asparagine synthase (glutamine-hydrolyzing) [Flavobacteriales bacterium]